MSLKHFSSHAQSVIGQFCRSAFQGESALVLGAGFSMNANYLDERSGGKFELWSSLIDRACKNLGHDPETFKRDHTYLEILEFYRQEFRDNALVQLIHDSTPDLNATPGALHQKLLNPRIFRWSSIITTNIDTLIERTLSQHRVAYRRLAQKEDFASGHGVPVVKLHGTFGAPLTYVFTESDYNGIDTRKPLLTAKVRQIYAENSCLFVGYSLRDPDFRRIVQTVRDLVTVDLRLSVALIPGASRHEKEYWRKHGVSILSRTDLVGDQTIATHDFIAASINAFAESLTADTPQSLSQLTSLTRLWRMRTLAATCGITPPSQQEGETTAQFFISDYRRRRRLATENLHFEHFPQEALRVLSETHGRANFTIVDEALSLHQPSAPLDMLCRDIADTAAASILQLGVGPDIPGRTLKLAMAAADTSGDVDSSLKLLLALDLQKPYPYIPVESEYSRSPNQDIRLLPQYLKILRMAEEGHVLEAKSQVYRKRREFDAVNPLWTALVLHTCGDAQATELAKGVLEGHEYDLSFKFLAAQFLRIVHYFHESEAPIHYDIAYLSRLAHDSGIPTEHLDFASIDENGVAALLEISARNAAETADTDKRQSAVEVFERLLTRHRLLGIPYSSVYDRVVLTNWLHLELDGPLPARSIIAYASGSPRTGVLRKTGFPERYGRRRFLQYKEWKRLQDFALSRFISGLKHGRRQASFFSEFVEDAHSYLTTGNFQKLLAEARTEGLVNFITYGAHRTADALIKHDSTLVNRQLEMLSAGQGDVTAVCGLVKGLDLNSLSEAARSTLSGLIPDAKINDLIVLSHIFAGEPEADTIASRAELSRYYEDTFSPHSEDSTADYKLLDKSMGNFVGCIAKSRVSERLDIARKAVDRILKSIDKPDARACLSSSFLYNFRCLLTQDSLPSGDIQLFDTVLNNYLSIDWRTECDWLFTDPSKLARCLHRHVEQNRDTDTWLRLVRSSPRLWSWMASRELLPKLVRKNAEEEIADLLGERLNDRNSFPGAVVWMFETLKAMEQEDVSIKKTLVNLFRELVGIGVARSNHIWMHLIPPAISMEQQGLLTGTNASQVAQALASSEDLIPTRHLLSQTWDLCKNLGTDAGACAKIGSSLIETGKQFCLIDLS